MFIAAAGYYLFSRIWLAVFMFYNPEFNPSIFGQNFVNSSWIQQG